MNQVKKVQKGGIAPQLGDMDATEFRNFGYQIVDFISDYLERIEEFPVLAQIEPGDLRRRLPASAPETGEPMGLILADVDRLILPALTHWVHPSFFAYFATSTSAPGIFGELLSAAFDEKAMLWRTSPASTELEQVTLSWLRQMMGLPDDFQGIIYDTASVSSMHAIAAARESVNQEIREKGMSGRPELSLLRIYASDQSHSSIEKSVITLGLGTRALHKVPSDSEFRMDAQALSRAIEEDKRAGMLPFCVVATVGTTSTTSIDPVPAIADICEQHNLWLHIDAAYAGSAAIVPELRCIVDGCDRADSFVTNPHKWLFTPFDLSVLYCKRMDQLRQAFALVPEYLRTPEAENVNNGSDYGIQLGRRFRSLKLWMILRYFGHEGLAARIREHCRLARLFESWVREAPGWEILAPAPLAVVCFRANPVVQGETEQEKRDRLDTLNEQLMHSVNATGKAFLSHTRLHGSLSLRLSVGNIRTTEKHVRAVWDLLRQHLNDSKPA